MNVLGPQLASLHNFLGAEPATSNEDLFFSWCLKPMIIQNEVSLLCSHSSSACAQNACAFKKRLGKHFSEILVLSEEKMWRQIKCNVLVLLLCVHVCICIYIHTCTYTQRIHCMYCMHYIISSNVCIVCIHS